MYVPSLFFAIFAAVINVKMEKDMARRYDKQEYAVGCYKFNGVLVREYSSIAEASEKSGIRYSQIWACVNGRTQQAGGFVWRKMG